jgi:soluble lytic murein transglycosylase
MKDKSATFNHTPGRQGRCFALFLPAACGKRKGAMRFWKPVLFLIFAVGAWWGYFYWREHRFDGVIAQAARRYQLEPALIKAVMWRESRFNPDAHGRAGELGLMQVREAAAVEWAADEHVAGFDFDSCLDPATNALAGTWYLRTMLWRYKQSDNPLPYALADYNAGRGNVLKWRTGSALTNSADFISQIGFPSTKMYVLSVMRRYEHYQ